MELFRVDPAPFFQQLINVIAPDDAKLASTYSDSVFEFRLTLANIVLRGGYIEIALPPEVQLPPVDPGSGQSAPKLIGKGVVGLKSELQVSIVSNNKETGTVLRVSDLFKDGVGRLGKSTTIKFTVALLRTPLTTESTSSFKILTKDAAARIVNFVLSDLRVTMLRGKHIPTLAVKASNYVVGASASHTFSFATPVPLERTDQIMIVYNLESSLPIRGSRCEGGEALAAGQSCSVTQDVLSTSSGLVFSGGRSTLEVGAKLSLTIFGAENPKTGRQTGIFTVHIKDRTGYVKA